MTYLDEDLEYHLISPPVDGEPILPLHEAETVVDADHANRLVRFIGHRRRRLAEARDAAEREHGRIDEWLKGCVARFATGDAERLLADWHRAVMADGGAKTVSLPAGEVKARTMPGLWQFDPDVFIPWAGANLPAALRTKVEVDKPAAKKLLAGYVADGVPVDAATGEVVPGVVVAEPTVSHTVTVNGGW